MSGNDAPGTPETEGQARKPFILERPLWRGLFNGTVLALLMLGAQSQGWLGPNTEIAAPDVYRALIYGAFFGLAMYLYQLTRWKRREKAEVAAAKAARERVEADLEKPDGKA